MRPGENAASWTVFWPEKVSHMAVPAKLDKFNSRKTAEPWADDAESTNGRRLQHDSGLNESGLNGVLAVDAGAVIPAAAEMSTS